MEQSLAALLRLPALYCRYVRLRELQGNLDAAQVGGGPLSLKVADHVDEHLLLLTKRFLAGWREQNAWRAKC